LLRVGFSHVGAAGVVLLAGVVICLATLALPTPGAVLVAACVAAAYLLLPSLLEARHRAVASSDSAPSRSGTKP
jgi:hypothetical protein